MLMLCVTIIVRSAFIWVLIKVWQKTRTILTHCLHRGEADPRKYLVMSTLQTQDILNLYMSVSVSPLPVSTVIHPMDFSLQLYCPSKCTFILNWCLFAKLCGCAYRETENSTIKEAAGDSMQNWLYWFSGDVADGCFWLIVSVFCVICTK